MRRVRRGKIPSGVASGAWLAAPKPRRTWSSLSFADVCLYGIPLWTVLDQGGLFIVGRMLFFGTCLLPLVWGSNTEPKKIHRLYAQLPSRGFPVLFFPVIGRCCSGAAVGRCVASAGQAVVSTNMCTRRRGCARERVGT